MHGKQSFWARIADFITGSPEPVRAPLARPVRVSERGVRLPLEGRTFELTMGRRRLHVSPDLAVTGSAQRDVQDLIIFDPQRYYGHVGTFARLAPGAALSINTTEDRPERLFTSPNDALGSSVRFRHEGDSLVLKAPPEPESFVTTVDEGPSDNRILAARRSAMRRIGEIYGGIFEPHAPEAALALLRRVNQLMENEPYRAEASDGRPGAMVELPAHKTPIVVGDLHGRVDNLLTLLSQDGFLDGLEKEQAALVILGDAVHPDSPDALEDMQSSVLIMDLIFRLKTTFPSGVFFLLGNHDSFSAELMKNGVPQGMLWDRHLTERRGSAYRDEMQRFYSLCPLLLVSEDFVACHAGAPRTRFTRQMLVEARQYPDLIHELIWNRQKTPGHAGGYTGADVHRFLHVLGMPNDATLVVGHYPRSETGSVWLNAGGIARHHVVISANPDEVALLTRVDGEFVAQIYAPEGLVAWLNGTDAERKGLDSDRDKPRPPPAPRTRHAYPDVC